MKTFIFALGLGLISLVSGGGTARADDFRNDGKRCACTYMCWWTNQEFRVEAPDKSPCAEAIRDCKSSCSGGLPPTSDCRYVSNGCWNTQQ